MCAYIMLNSQFPLDVKEELSRQRRRVNEEQRKKRILDEKMRKMGIDVCGLKQQIAEKQNKKLLERREKEVYEEDVARKVETAKIHERQVTAATRQLNKSINNFRFYYQTPQTRRDFDLSDPEALKKSSPPRKSDDDSKCGVSSLQRFSGEDLTFNERLKLQKEEMQKGLTEQIRIKKLIAESVKQQCERATQQMFQKLEHDHESERKVSSLRRELSLADQDYNQFLADVKRSANLERRQREADANYREMLNHLHSDILNENPRLCKSAYGAHRVTPDRWKGLSKEELEQILSQQKAQVEEQKRSRRSEWERHRSLEQSLLEKDRNDILEYRQKERLRREENRKIMEENMILADEQKSRQKYLNSAHCRTNIGDFFAKFGQSCR